MEVRKYPDIEFVDTDTDTLINSLIRSYELFTGRTLYPADPVRLFILWIADIIIQERINIDFSAKQNIPRYAEGEYLDSLAELFKNTYRLKAEKARTTFRFTLSTVLDTAVIIPKGTRVSVDSDITFATNEDLVIPAGEIYKDTAAECLTAGEAGNGFIPGQIKQLVDIFPYYEKVENITESAGGAESESDEAFYNRMRESVETFSTAGPIGAYEYYAKTASSLVADIKASSPEPGEVDIRILLQNGELPEDEVLKKVADVLSDDTVRPLTDHVTVSAPETVTYNIDATYYLQEGGAVSAEMIKIEAENAVSDFIKWQSEKMGRDINPSRLISMMVQAGVKRVDIREPLFTIISDNAVAQVGEVTILNGGVESE